MKNISTMKKIFDDSLYRDPRFFRVNELEDHAYFIPFPDPEKVRRGREESEAFYSLNGIWKFRWEPSVYQMGAFYEKEYPLEGFSEVAVPENWQLHGVDRAQYQSSPYTFIFDPPHVPEKNPAAAYCREFDFFPQEGKRYELHFEGKDSCIYVWLNGSFAGYGEAPHCDSAFDITPYLAEGRNRLCVMVLKWCSGSYLDDQDKLRLSGLFRDVYILERNPAGIRDFQLTTANDGTVTLAVEAGAPVEVQLLDRGRVIGRGRVLLPGENCEGGSQNGDASRSEEDSQCGEITFIVENPVLWSAEKPYLYELILSCDGEHMLHRFGFREVCIRDGVFMVNDRPVKLYGVNRHDANPDTGYVVDVAFMKKELLLMKQHNINAIRTAHYPNDPRFYELCDELGFYVLSEADLEFHGCHYVEGWAELQEKPMYGPAIHDRIARMMTRLKNYTCIVIWSLGNESSWGNNLKQEAYYARKADTTRLLHYERAFTEYASMSGEEKKELNGLFDFYCQMYTTLEKVDRIFEDESIQIPYLLSEYSHAMGNSCGDLGFYDDIFQKDPRYAGGFVWEWCDHGIRKQDEAGREYMAYGGDFGERHHLWNVCQDGLVSPDRVPHSALDELKAVYAPVQVERDAQGRVFLRNRNAFTDLEEFEVCWKIAAERESAPVCKRVPYGGTLSTLEEESVSCRLLAEGSCVLSCEPGAWAELPLEIKVPGDCLNPWIEVKVRLKEDTAWAPRGHVVAAWGDFLEAGEQQNVGELQEAGEQQNVGELQEAGEQQTGCPETAEQKPAGCTLQETRSAYIVSGKMESGEDYTYIFRKDEGVLSQVILHGQELLKAPMTLNCFRAPTDNDYRWRTGIAVSWNKTGEFGNIEYPELLVKNFRAEADEEGVRLKGDFIFSVQGRCAISRGRITYRIGQDGRLTISQKGSIAESLPYWLPRYGYTFVLREDMDRIQYLGWGEKECYEDKRRHALPGIHTYTCDDLAQMYERPQEWGSHCDTRWVKLQGAEAGMKISGEKFSFGASHYDMHQAAQVPHRKDLVRKEALYLYVDYRMSGVGSASVGGQPPVPECRINPGEAYDFTIEILPM